MRQRARRCPTRSAARRGQALRADHRGRRPRPRRSRRTCVGLLGPNGAGKSTTMRMLTGQAVADEGTIDVLGFSLPQQSKLLPRPMRRHAPARQPGHHADRRAEPPGLQPPLPRRAGRSQGRDPARALRSPTSPSGATPGGQVQRRHAPAPADRRAADPPSAPRAARRADRRPGPAGAPGAVGADRSHALGGHDDPDVHALHRGGGAAGRHGRDRVQRHGDRRRAAADLVTSTPAPRPSRSTERPRAARSRRGAPPRPAHPADGTSVSVLGIDRATDSRPRANAADEPRGRLRPADGRGDRMRAPRPRALLPPRGSSAPRSPASSCRRVVNFSSYWRSTTFSSTVEPTIYLVAFGLGFGSLVSTVAGYDYVDFVGTGTVATAVLFSSAFPSMFGTFVKYQFQRTYDAILAAPSTSRSSSRPRRCGSASRAGTTAACRCSSRWSSAWTPLGMLLVPFIARIAGFGWASVGIFIAGAARADRELQLLVSALLTPLFLVAGTFFPIDGLPEWAQARPSSTRSTTASSSSATPCSGSTADRPRPRCDRRFGLADVAAGDLAMERAPHRAGRASSCRSLPW